MKTKLFTGALALFSSILFSQSVPRAFEDWKTTAGTQNFFYKNVTKTDAFGNVFVAGGTMSNGAPDILVAKYNAKGVQLWIQQFSGAVLNGIDFAAGLYVTDTHVYLTGAITNNTTTPETDCFTMKLKTTTGSVVWNTSYTGSAGNIDAGKFVIVDGAGDVYVTGTTYNSSGNADYLTLKYSGASGSQTWVNTWGYSSGLDDGAIKAVLRGTEVTVTGAVTSTTNNYKVATITMPQSTGVTSATNIAAAVTTTSVDAVVDMTTDALGNIIIIGSQYVSGQGNNFYCQKVAGGTLISAWTYTWNGTGNLDDYGKAVAVDAANNVFIAGSSMSTTLGKELTLIKLNSSGIFQTSVQSGFAGNDEAADMIIDASNNVYLTGYRDNATYLNKNYYTVKYSNAVSKVWEIETDGMSYDDNATNLTLDSLNNVIVTGQSSTSSTGDFRFLTTKYVQMDTKDPIDLLSQQSNKNFGYHQNRGQVRNDAGGVASSVLYYTHNQYPKIYIEKNAFNYVFTKTDTVVSVSDTIERIKVSFSEASANAVPYGYNPKTYPLNYFLGHTGEPITDVKGQDRVITKNIYTNIDLHYYSNSKGFKYYFVINPGGNPSDIRMYVSGAITTSIISSNLFIDGKLGDITLKQPYAYMVNGAGITTTLSAVSWTNTSGQYKITTPTYTNTQTLIYVVETVNAASPTGNTANMEYSTYYGKTDNDIFKDIRVATNGDRYIVGNTDGNNFPVTPGTLAYNAFTDAVLLKYSVTKDSLVFATFYGGGGSESGNSVDINSLNEVYIAGQTFSSGSNGIPTYSLGGASNQVSNGMSIAPSGASPGDGFIARFSPFGNVLTWGRYYGGSQDDGINSIYIDNSNNIYFTGQARSNNITMVSAAQSAISTSTATNTDAILGKFNGSNTLVYSTYLGGGVSAFSATKDVGRDITVDGSGNVIVVGSTDANNFPVSNSTGNSNTFYDASLGGAQDGFIARYSPTGAKQFASFFGGAGTYGIDEIARVNYNAVKDEIYFAGQSNDTTSFPYVILSGAFNLKRKATNAAFIASMTGNLTKQWSTSYGKAASNFSVTGLASDNAGIVYLTGQAKSNTLNYPASTPTLTVYKDTILNGDDGFVTIFNPQKNLFHAHYLGGTGNDYINNAYVGTNNKLYVVGNTGSVDYPVAYNSVNIQFIDTTFGGGIGQNDGFITRFDMGSIQIISVKETSSDDYMLNVYPNPSTSGFILDMKNDELKNVQAKVYNITGQLIVEQKISQPQTQFYCESWANGVYLINVNANGKLKTFKLIKN